MDYLKAFLIGGAICVVGQILIDRTKLTPARILVCYVVLGVILGGADVYEKLVDFAGAGATVPLTGFGNTLAKGVREAVQEQGVLGANDTVVSVVTGNGLKDVANAIKFCGEPMSLPNDLDLLVEEFAKRGIKTK